MSRLDPALGPATGRVVKRHDGRTVDQLSTQPDGSVFCTDDRPLKVAKRKDGRYDVVRLDGRVQEGHIIVRGGLGSSGEAAFELERQRAIVPHTDRTRQSRARSTFYGFNVPEGGFK